MDAFSSLANGSCNEGAMGRGGWVPGGGGTLIGYLIFFRSPKGLNPKI